MSCYYLYVTVQRTMYSIVQKNWQSTFTISNYKKLNKIIYKLKNIDVNTQ